MTKAQASGIRKDLQAVGVMEDLWLPPSGTGGVKPFPWQAAVLRARKRAHEESTQEGVLGSIEASQGWLRSIRVNSSHAGHPKQFLGATTSKAQAKRGKKEEKCVVIKKNCAQFKDLCISKVIPAALHISGVDNGVADAVDKVIDCIRRLISPTILMEVRLPSTLNYISKPYCVNY